MTESFLSLSDSDRTEALQVAASRSGRPLHILEKDVWVVWSLSALFESPFGTHLVFKGGTSLSKAYKAIERFSEDVDVTYDIRALAEDLVREAGDEPLPNSKTQGKKWSDTIRERLPTWLHEVVLPHLRQRFEALHLDGTVRVESDCIFIDYPARTDGYGYVPPRVKIEFGARSTGEPAEERTVSCDAAEQVTAVSFPVATPRVMRVERTIWEKMTAIHVFCTQGKIKDRQARHWYDIAKLDTSGYVDVALKDRNVAQRVAKHKAWFFAAKDHEGKPIDYERAISGGLVLVPVTAEVLNTLKADYEQMITDRLFLGEPESLDWVIDRCKTIETKANALS